MRCLYSLSASIALLLAAAPVARAQRSDTLALSLPDAINLAFRSSDEARLAGAATELAGAQFESARASLFPQLRFNGTYSHVYRSARAVAVGAVFNQPNTYTTTANLSQSLFQGGRELYGWRSAERLRGAAELTERETRAQVTLDVQRAYLQALYTDRAVDIRRQNFALVDSQVAQVERLEKAGRAARYDVLVARVNRANQEPLLQQAIEDRTLALLELKRILNLPAEQPLTLSTSLDASMVEPLLTAAGDSVMNAADRPSVRAAELTARARHEAIGVARADYLPTIGVNVALGYQAFPFGNTLPSFQGQRVPTTCASPATGICSTQNGGFFPDRSLSLTVTWPIFDGFRTKANVDIARALALVADLQLQQQRETATIDIARARADLVRTRATFTARRQNSTEAGEALQLASLRFARGLSTQLEVSTAQLALLTAQTDEARSIYDLYLASASLLRALGRPMPLPPGVLPPSRTSLKTDTSAQISR
ncbi:MAG: TolC family protein [Gemmatimonadaceae bacterium]